MTIKFKKFDKLMHKERYFARSDFERYTFLILLEDYDPEINKQVLAYNSYNNIFHTCEMDGYSFKDFILVESEPGLITTASSFRLRNRNICSVGCIMQSINPISNTDERHARLLVSDEIVLIKNKDKRKMPATLFSCYHIEQNFSSKIDGETLSSKYKKC